MKPDPSLDVTREPVGLSSETEDAVIVGGVPAPENKRRRLVRGAVAFAPLVLTLRSGALAAASCTGVKIATGAYTKDGGLRAGKIKNAPGVVEGDVCVEAGALQACGTDQSRVETLSNLTVNNTAPVTTRHDDRGSWLSCGEPSQFVGQPIAILSSQSAASMGISQG